MYVIYLLFLPSFTTSLLAPLLISSYSITSFLPPLRIFSSYSIPSFLPLFFLTYTSLPFLLIPFLSFVLLLFYFLTFLSLSSLLSILYDFKRQALTLDNPLPLIHSLFSSFFFAFVFFFFIMTSLSSSFFSILSDKNLSTHKLRVIQFDHCPLSFKR